MAIACLLGGNLDAQNRFATYIKGDATNKFMLSLKDLTVSAIDNVKETQ